MSTIQFSLLHLAAFVSTMASSTVLAQDDAGSGSDDGQVSLAVILSTVLGVPGALSIIICCIRRQCQKNKKKKKNTAVQQAQPSHEPIDEDAPSSVTSDEPGTTTGDTHDRPAESFSVPVASDGKKAVEVGDHDPSVVFDRISHYLEDASYG
jgi:cytoskeletal protein RodZ